MSTLKPLARRVAATGGLFHVARHWTGRWPRIVMYHGFCGPGDPAATGTPVELFRQQLRYITQHYLPLRLCELGRAWRAGTAPPRRAVVITVDDGYASFRRWALPVLQELGVPATLFVVSDLPDSGRWLWTDKLTYLTAGTNHSPSSAEAVEALRASLKRLSPAERERRLQELAERAGAHIPTPPPAPYALLSGPELAEVAASPLVDIGSHSRTHPILSTLDPATAWQEINGSREDLERRLGISVTAFCYPNGGHSDYTAEHIAMVAKAGYDCATAAHFGLVTAASSPFALPRIGAVSDDMSMFCKYLDGLEYVQQRWAGRQCW